MKRAVDYSDLPPVTSFRWPVRMRGSVEAMLLRTRKSGSGSGDIGVPVPPIFSCYHQLPTQLRRAYGVEVGFDLSGAETEMCLLQERLRDCVLAALDANVITCLEAFCGSCHGSFRRIRKTISHCAAVPRRSDAGIADDLGNVTYVNTMNVLRSACMDVLGRSCACSCSNIEMVGDHLEAVMGAALLLSGTKFKEPTPGT